MGFIESRFVGGDNVHIQVMGSGKMTGGGRLEVEGGEGHGWGDGRLVVKEENDMSSCCLS